MLPNSTPDRSDRGPRTQGVLGKRSARIWAQLCFIALAGCISRDDERFPEFSPNAPIIISSNESVRIGEAYRPREICRIDSNASANKIYYNLREKFKNGWQVTVTSHYVPKYHIDFGGTKITVSSGGLTIQALRDNYVFRSRGRVNFNKHLSELETFKLIQYLCPDADPAGGREFPVIEVDVRNSLDQTLSNLTISGGERDILVANVNPKSSVVVSLIPDADSNLKLSFNISSQHKKECEFASVALTKGMHGKIELSIDAVNICKVVRDSTALF